MTMWSRVAHTVLQGQIQHRRIHGAAAWILAIRLAEGAGTWVVLRWYFSQVTVPLWAQDLIFVAYGLANVVLFFPQRREAMTPGLIWFDITANLVPMAAATHWSGGLYSPLLPIFVLKISSYGLIYGVDTGIQSFAAATLGAVGFAVLERWGLAAGHSVEYVPVAVRQRLTLAVAGLVFLIIIIGSLRFFRLFQDREDRLNQVAREMNRLYHESLRHQEHLRRLSQRMVQASERMMQMLARELHDDLGQGLTAAKMHLSLIDRELSADSPIRLHVHEARGQIGAVLQSVRHLSQLLRPAVLDDLGLVPAMQSYISRFAERTGIPVDLESPAPEMRLPPPIELALYRVLQEALTNVARHADAGHVHVWLETNPDLVSLRITDDGRGFDAAAFIENPPSDHGMGVIGMRERVATYGGRFAIHSQPGAGTRVDLSISLAQSFVEPKDSYGNDSRLVG
jgi:signal transduction histidine kinase